MTKFQSFRIPGFCVPSLLCEQTFHTLNQIAQRVVLAPSQFLFLLPRGMTLCNQCKQPAEDMASREYSASCLTFLVHPIYPPSPKNEPKDASTQNSLGARQIRVTVRCWTSSLSKVRRLPLPLLTRAQRAIDRTRKSMSKLQFR